MHAPPQCWRSRSEHPDSRSEHVTVYLFTYHPQPQPVFSVPDVVDQQTGGTVVVNHQDIRVAVVIDVAESNTAAHLGQSYDGTGFLTHIFIAAISGFLDMRFLLLNGIRS